jgi:C-terminal processing protease CtpA/Prc
VSVLLLQGLFVALVQNNLPAALAGLRFGDQILQINGQNVAGWNTDKAHEFVMMKLIYFTFKIKY